MAARGGWGLGTLTEVQKGKWLYRLPVHLGRGQVTFLARTRTEALKRAQTIRDEKAAPPMPVSVSYDEACEWLLDHHNQDPHSTERLRSALRLSRQKFGHLPVADVRYEDITEWQTTLGHLSPVTRHGYTQAVKQVLNSCVKRRLIAESPARHIANPDPGVGDVRPFEKLEEAQALARELIPAYRALPVFGCMTGLRPEEWLALERADIRAGFIHVNKRYVRGVVKPGTKNGEPERRVPVHPLVAEALRAHPTRLDTRLLFPAKGGGYLILNDFRYDVWQPAMTAAGINPARRLKDMRHTFATWQLTGNCNVWTLSKVMGTAVAQIERTYGRWIPGSEGVMLAAMDSFVERQTAAK